VIGGKFSEGVDFKNELARLIIVIGIPLANYYDNFIKSKKMYLIGHSQNSSNIELNRLIYQTIV
jgi:Rad3-related DNA helicase